MLKKEDVTQLATDESGNSTDGSSVFEITFNVPQAEYVGYDVDCVARFDVEKCKAAGMIELPENLDILLAEGRLHWKNTMSIIPMMIAVTMSKDHIKYK